MRKQRARDGAGVAAAVGGLGVGAGLMFLLDPRQGRRRRALIRDQAVRVWHDTEQLTRAGVRDATHRARGFVAETRSALSEGEVDDEVLAERIKSKIGRVVGHPNALEIQVHDGRAILRGPILAREVQRLLECVESVRGVKGFDNQLEVHRTADDVSALQGEGRVAERGLIPLRSWHPATKLLVGGAGALLLGWAMLRSFWVALAGLTAAAVVIGERARGEAETAPTEPQPQATS